MPERQHGQSLNCTNEFKSTNQKASRNKKKASLNRKPSLPEKRLELADDRRTVKKQCESIVLGSSIVRLRARAVPEREFKAETSEKHKLKKKNPEDLGILKEYRRRDLNSYTIARNRF